MGLKLLAEIALDGSGFERGLNTLSKRIGQVFTLAAVEEFGRRMVNNVSRIKDLSEQFQVTTDEVQRLDFAAKQNSMSFEAVGTALVKLGKARREAAESNDQLLATFAKYGVTLEDLNNPAKRNVDLLNQIGAAISNMNLTAADRTELDDLLGRVGEKLEVVLRDASRLEGLEIITDDQIQRIDKAAKALEKAGRNAQNMLTNVLGTLAEWYQAGWENIGAGVLLAAQGMSAIDIGSALRADSDVQEEMAREAEAAANETAASSGDLFKDKRKEKLEGDRPARAPQPASDALSSVGNFLGQGGAMIVSIAEQQLDVQRRSLAEQQGLRQDFQGLKSELANLKSDLDIP